MQQHHKKKMQTAPNFLPLTVSTIVADEHILIIQNC